MSESLVERYKEALRRGHAAALKARFDEALEAYGEAAGLAPDRALPLVSSATVLARLGRRDEARAAFDAALDRAPDDEAALRGRADVLLAAGDRRAAAETMDRLAGVLESAGRLPEATDAARRALEFAESRSRREGVAQLAARLRGTSGDVEAAAALERVSGLLGEAPTAGPLRRLVPAGSPAATGEAGEAGGPAEGAEEDAGATEAGHDQTPSPFNPVTALAAVDAAFDGGDPPTILEVVLSTAAGHRAADQLLAALDVCYRALGTVPDDPDLHLALAELYLDLGWRAPAVDKLVLLARLAELTADDGTKQRLCEVAARRLPDEPRLAERCA
ncbi:MAG: hypothetical protein WKF56_06910, partial [Candidatus Limnocylindrales bacterium]